MAKIKLLVLSDLHLEFAEFRVSDSSKFDVVILAGDIGTGPRAVGWAARNFRGKPVIFVPGNHEFYGFERTRALERLREAAMGTCVHLLDRDGVTIDGVRFLGATLWTDFALDVAAGTSVSQAMRDGESGLNDFAGQIHEHETGNLIATRFKPWQAAREHALSCAWLLERLQSATGNGPTVVVTHHAPCSKSMHPQYAGSKLNPCFYSDLPSEFFQRAELWVHGHTHSSSDYQHYRTRIVANPRGYVNWKGRAENGSFVPDLVVEIDQ